jgi:hypothetical protein
MNVQKAMEIVRPMQAMTRNVWAALTAAISIAFSGLVQLAGSASAQTDSFNPSICPSGGNGTLTLRLVSGLAFQVPATGFLLRDAMPDPQDASLPPYGCPENPVITRAISFEYRYEALLADKFNPDVPKGRPDRLMIVGHDGPTRLQDSALKSFERAKGQFGSCELTNEGLEVCRDCAVIGDWCANESNGSAVIKFAARAYFRAPVGLYTESRGRSFVVKCDWGWPQNTVRPRNRECDVRYEMSDGLSVVYRFSDPASGEDQFLKFDRAIRQQITDMRVPQLDRPPTWDLGEGSVGWIRVDQDGHD